MSPGKLLGGRVAPESNSTAMRSGFHPFPRDGRSSPRTQHRSQAGNAISAFISFPEGPRRCHLHLMGHAHPRTDHQGRRRDHDYLMSPQAGEGSELAFQPLSWEVGRVYQKEEKGCWVGNQQESQRGWEVGVTGNECLIFLSDSNCFPHQIPLPLFPWVWPSAL